MDEIDRHAAEHYEEQLQMQLHCVNSLLEKIRNCGMDVQLGMELRDDGRQRVFSGPLRELPG